MHTEKEKTILLGGCPFCGKGVTASISRTDKYAGDLWYVFYRYDNRPECPNGCPIDQFNDFSAFFNGYTLAKDYNPARWFRMVWALDVRWFKERSKCPHCGRPAQLRTGKEPAMGCHHCGLWAEDIVSTGEVTVERLVEAWEYLVKEQTPTNGGKE